MKRITLKAQKRSIVGRKVKQLRQSHLVPGNVFGKQVKSVSVQLPLDIFTKVYREAGETGLIDLDIEGDVRPVLIQNVQTHSVSALPLHVDFYQVDLTQKVKANVPLEVVGTPAAVAQKLGLLLELLDEVEVEALPTELPEKIEINVASLAQVGDTVKVGDLVLPSGVQILTDTESEVVKIGSLVTKEAEEQAAAEEAAKAAAAAEAGTEVSTEGAPASEGAAPATPDAKAAKPVPETAKAEK